jgi:hypothetical protein
MICHHKPPKVERLKEKWINSSIYDIPKNSFRVLNENQSIISCRQKYLLAKKDKKMGQRPLLI